MFKVNVCIGISFFFAAPLCPKPPETTEEGVREYHPIPIPVDVEEECGLDSEELPLKCHSFLSIYIYNVTYGRGPGKELFLWPERHSGPN